MISKEALVGIVLALPFVLDYEAPRRMPIPRSAKVANVIAVASLETDSPIATAIFLDVVGAHESGYVTSAIGDHFDGIGRSCGAWQTPCARTPGFSRCTEGEGCRWGWVFHGQPTTALAQARVAISIWQRAREGCPDHPMWMYASGNCSRSRTADLYENDMDSETTSTDTLASQ